MNYEKKYKEAFERAKTLYVNASGMILKKCVEQIFPELKESKDERIRQFLIQEVTETSDEIMSYRNMNKEDVLAWLEKQGKNDMGISEATKQKLVDNLNKALGKETPESWDKFLDKQGEQKSADKVEPKFKVGDTIYFNSFGKIKSMVVYTIIDNGDGNPMYEDVYGYSVLEKDII